MTNHGSQKGSSNPKRLPLRAPHQGIDVALSGVEILKAAGVRLWSTNGYWRCLIDQQSTVDAYSLPGIDFYGLVTGQTVHELLVDE
jgi:hypothetical protein